MYTYKFGLPKSADVFMFCLYFREHPPTYLKNEKRDFLLRPNHQFILDSYTLHIHLQNLQFWCTVWRIFTEVSYVSKTVHVIKGTYSVSGFLPVELPSSL